MVIGEASSKEKDLAYSVPQGNVAGPVLYNCYASTISEVVKPPLQLHELQMIIQSGIASSQALRKKHWS